MEERRGSAIFYFEEEAEEEAEEAMEQEEAEEAVKQEEEEESVKQEAVKQEEEEEAVKQEEDFDTTQTTETEDTEKYTVVAVRAKLSVEVEQRKRLGTWAKRVLVLDGSTLYAYKTKGEGGSVGGWAVGGADVRVGRGSDSSRDDGRHLLVVSRPPAYKLTFSFNTTYEQARMIQALSSSGATVNGLDAIMLLKNLKKQQEEEQEEEEERQRHLREQIKAFEESRQRNDTVTSDGSGLEERKEDAVSSEDDQLSIEYEKNKEEEELEVNRSIYDEWTGVVSNPLYSSQINLSSCDGGGDDAKDKGYSTYRYSGTSGVSDAWALASGASVGNDDSAGKVNPVPKPPRTSNSERRPSTESKSFQFDDETKNDTKARDAPRQQSTCGGGKEEKARDIVGLEDGQVDERSVEDDEGSHFDSRTLVEEVEDDDHDLEIVEARNTLYSNPEDSEEGEGSYQVNSDSEEDIYHGGSESNLRKHPEIIVDDESNAVDFLRNDASSESSLTDEEKDEERRKGSFEGKYSDLLYKMKLERALSIDSEANGHSPELGSPSGYRRSGLNSPIDISQCNSPIPLDDRGNGGDRDENGRYGSERERCNMQSPSEEEKIIQNAFNDALSDSEEKFEQLYNSLGNDSSEYLESESYEENESPEHTTDEENVTNVREGKIEKSSVTPGDNIKENGHIAGEDVPDSPSRSTSETTFKKRVNSIIKKKDKELPASGTGTVKKVQFNLDVDTIEPSATSESESPATPPDPAQKNDEFATTSATEKMASATEKAASESSPESLGGTDARKEATGTARTSPTTEKKTTDSNAGSQTKKQAAEPKSPPSPSKKKSTDSLVTSPSKKKVAEPSNTHTLTKKKGLFSSIFSISSSKKGESSSSKDDVGSKKSSDSPAPAVKRQQTVDLSAPLVISGQVEIGGSVGGRLNPRRVEVRDGHVLAYLLRGASTPSSRISLVGLSVTPVLGGVYAHALSLSRASRCMMVIKLGSREELMLWVNTLSDEVLRVTPEDQRSGLTVYPSSQKKTEKTKEIRGEEREGEREGQEQESSNNEKEQRENKATGNCDVGDAGEPAKMASPTEEISATRSRETATAVNGGPLANPRDKGQTVPRQDEEYVFSPQRSASVDSLNEISERRKLAPSDLSYHSRTLSESGEVSKIGSRIQRTILQLSQEQLDSEYTPAKTDSYAARNHKSNHPPLRRLSGQGSVTPPPSDLGTDTVDNYLMVNTLPGSSSNRHAGGYQPTEKLTRSSRIISSSESSLRMSVDSQASAGPRPMQRYGSEIISNANTRDQPGHVGNRITRDKVLTLASGYRGSQTSMSDSDSQLVNERRASSTSSSSQSLSRYNLVQPRKIEIIEKSSNIRRRSDGQEKKFVADDDRWFGDNDSSGTEAPTPMKDEAEVMPGITWSVAATREKFELLCSVSGESKGGRLTTKTPISRKRSARSSVKKKRSLEGAVSRKSTVRRSARWSLEDELTNSSQELQTDASDSNLDRYAQREMRLQPRGIAVNSVKDQTRSSSPVVCSTSPVDAYDRAPTPDTFLREDSPTSKKAPLRRTSNILQEQCSPASSPEPRILTSRSLNTRPQGSCVGGDRGILSLSSSGDSSRPPSSQDSDVVVCWRGPYIAQDPASEPTARDEGGVRSPQIQLTEKETEQAVLSNISNAFLAKRRLLAREVAAARFQERLSLLEERLWELQARMAEIDVSGVVSTRETREWKSLEKSLRAVEEETMYWNTRLKQTKKEAEQARQKLAAALASGLAQLSPSSSDHHRSQGRDSEVSEA